MQFNKTHEYSKISLIVFFFVIIFVGFVGSFLKHDSLPDFREQRVLAQAPGLEDLKSISSLPSLLTKFSSDNFGYRKQLLSYYFKLRLLILAADLGMPSLLGRDGWLFVDAEIPLFRNENILTREQSEEIRGRLDEWCEYAHAHGAEFVFVVGPNKSTIYPEKLPDYLVRFNDRPSLLDQVYALNFNCRFTRVDLRKSLAGHSNTLLYYKWGTHWNEQGAQLAWLAIKDEVDKVTPGLGWPSLTSSMSYRPAEPLEDSMWQWFGQNDPYTVMLPAIKLNDISQGYQHQKRPKILAFGDSFLQFMFSTAGIVATDYATWILQAGETFSPKMQDAGKDAWLITAFGNQRNIEIMDNFQPNLVMLEIVERNILTIANLNKPTNAENTPFNLTDKNWINGVSRSFVGFFVSNTLPNRKEFTLGNKVRFINGQTRKILRQEASGLYLNIYLDGEVLNGALVGYPNKLEIIK